MKRKLQILLVALVSQLTSYCITYDYSYTFGERTVSGTLDGNANGDFVENVSDVKLNIFGETVAPVYIGTHTPTVAGLPVVSFKAELNNFVFIDVDVFNTFNQSLKHFYFSGGLAFATVFGGVSTDTSFSRELSNWSLTARQTDPSAVPEGGATVALLALGMSSLAFARRKLS